jgi:carboxylesterase type B
MMWRTALPLLLAARGVATAATRDAVPPTVFDSVHNVTYVGLERNGIEIFLNIRYGQDTSGSNRFRPPRPNTLEPGTIVNAMEYGPACPQKLRESNNPTELSTISHVSEDCLNLNIARPKGLKPATAADGGSALLPVMVYIHGGSYFVGWNGDLSIAPDGLVRQADENGTPVLHVAMNYRLGGKCSFLSPW